MKCPHCGFTTRYTCEVCRKEYATPWKPYPQNSPKKSGRYLVTVKQIGMTEVFIAYFEHSPKDYDYSWHDSHGGIPEECVFAFADIPDKYSKSEDA